MSAQSDSDSPPEQARFTRLIDACRGIAVQYLGMLFNGVIEGASEALLEFADKAENNAMQARFFEAIQGIGRGRQNIKRIFEGEIKIGFAQFTRGHPVAVVGGAERAPGHKTVTGFDTGGLQLLDKLAHEESAAIQTLAAKSGNRYLESLYALSQRLAVINGGNRLEDAALPAGPTHILNAFNASIRPLRLQPNIKLVLFVVFDRIVMTQLDAFYEDLNLCLIKAGVLPNLRPSVTKSANTATPATKPPAGQEQQIVSHGGHQGAGAQAATAVTAGSYYDSSGGQQGAATGQYADSGNRAAAVIDGNELSVGEQLFGSIRELLAACHRAGSATTSAAGAAAAPANVDAGPPVAPYTDNAMLVSVINQLQVEQVLPDATEDPAQMQPEHVDKSVLEAIRSKLQTQRQRIYEGVDRRRVPQLEIDVIDVVGMLFDYILNDEVLPNAVKALLSRLHTPYLKIAVLDKRMFSSDQHPARLLLNIMADAGGKWVSQDRLQVGIYPQMRYVVERVLNEFQDGMQLFEDLIEEFTASVEVMKEKAALIEKRAHEAAKGQEKLQLARDRAREELVARMAGKQIPGVARKFLSETWADHLMLILLRSHNEDTSQDFVEALRIADEIVWSVTPKHTQVEREQMSLRLPKLQHIIENELGSLGGYSRDEQEDLYSLLKDLQTNALHGTPEEADLDVADEPGVATVETLPVVAEQEVVGAEEQAILDELRKLDFGTLIDFDIGSADGSRRLKLSWFSQVTSNYMFVDQAGVKAAVYNVHELARALREGHARVVMEHNKPFFEWALEAIRNVLKGSIGSRH